MVWVEIASGYLLCLICDLRIGPVDGDVTVEDMKDVDNKPRQEDIKKDMGKHQTDVDMEAKFHKWMERMGREYPNQEEKAYRFELLQGKDEANRDFHWSKESPPKRFRRHDRWWDQGNNELPQAS